MKNSYGNFPIIDLAGTGKNIKKLMSSKNLSAKDIQTFLNLGSVQAVYKWIWGNSLPTIDNFVALSKLFQVPIDKIIVIKNI